MGIEKPLSEYELLQEKAAKIYEAGRQLGVGENVTVEVGSVPPSNEPTMDGLVRKLDNSPEAAGTFLSLAFDQESGTVNILRRKE